MGTTALKQLLKSLCHGSCWNYAVLWKPRHGSPIILSWEDGYLDYPKPRKPLGNMLDGVSSHLANDVLQFEVSSPNCSYEEYQIGNMVADMSNLQYVFGEGYVGGVASTGNHCWVSFRNIFGDGIHPELVPQCPDEWLLQFASGIKTILLVPILPHGVLQLGSVEEVPDNTDMVAFIKSRLNSLYRSGGNTITSSRDFKPQLPSSLACDPIDTFSLPPTVSINLKSEDSYPSTDINCIKLKESFPENNSFSHSDAFHEASPIGSMDSMQLEMVESKLFELSCLMGELQTYSDYNNDHAGDFGDSFNSIMNAYSSGDAEWKPAEFMAANNVTGVLSFPQDCELHKALGSSFWSQTLEEPWDTSFFERSCHSDHSNRAENPWVAKGDLLEPIVTNFYSGSDDTSSDMCGNSKSTSSPRFQTSSSQPPHETDASVLVEDDSGPRSQVAQVTSDFVVTRGTSSNATPASTKDIIHAKFEKEHEGQGRNNIHSGKGQKISNTRRRAKPGNNSHKPRPRDRQLIQDRVKELRELVPNGTKCSIDGLLDQTIKHMLYLRSVTDQAQKLGDWVDDEVSSRKNRRSCEAEDNSQTGTSVAFEFGSELQLCPIVVEDLAHPGHMLIEMLCNDHGLFLEIAQVIRGLQLTVLKGVMESRSNNTWAHFVVKACEGFHRLDIFWPLMQLLQRKTQPISSKI